VPGAVTVDVKGLPELERALGRMSGFQAQAIREKAILAGARGLVRPMRAMAPQGPTGNLRRQVGARKARNVGGSGRDPQTVVVGSVAPHRHLVIRGTKPRYTKAGAFRGVMPSNPFVDRAWQANAGQVMARIRAVYAAEIKRAWHG
jgi:hypothetical protein